jgi:O-antigen/teichoic acid export membrane protein
MRIIHYLKNLPNSLVIKNSIWGVASSILQNVLLSVFFIIIARTYSTTEFAQFLIANTLYQIIAAFSAMGLGQWFIREYMELEDKQSLIAKFLKIQLFFGLFFYVMSISIGFLLYDDSQVRNLIIILSVNVVFDNIIYAIKNLNIAAFEQKKTFQILLIDSILRFSIGAVLLILPLEVTTLSIVVIVARFCTLYMFLRIGIPKTLGLRQIWTSTVQFKDVKALVSSNWSFVIIGALSIVYWRLAGIVISKVLTDKDVANYEVSFKIFTLAQIVPLILSATVFPSLVKIFASGIIEDFIKFYQKVFKLYYIFGLAAFTFVYSFSAQIVGYAFGPNYAETASYTNQMFLTMLVFPTAFLQANVLVAMKLEKLDMWINMLSLACYLLFALIGTFFLKSLSVINYSIFISFIIFHVIQDKILISRGVTTIKTVALFYVITASLVLTYIFTCLFVNPITTFFMFWTIVAVVIIANMKKATLALTHS